MALLPVLFSSISHVKNISCEEYRNMYTPHSLAWHKEAHSLIYAHRSICMNVPIMKRPHHISSNNGNNNGNTKEVETTAITTNLTRCQNSKHQNTKTTNIKIKHIHTEEKSSLALACCPCRGCCCNAYACKQIVWRRKTSQGFCRSLDFKSTILDL